MTLPLPLIFGALWLLCGVAVVSMLAQDQKAWGPPPGRVRSWRERAGIVAILLLGPGFLLWAMAILFWSGKGRK